MRLPFTPIALGLALALWGCGASPGTGASAAWSCPEPVNKNVPCLISWSCQEGTREASCAAADGGGFACRCAVDGVEVKTFSSSVACTVSASDWEAAARAGCGWPAAPDAGR